MKSCVACSAKDSSTLQYGAMYACASAVIAHATSYASIARASPRRIDAMARPRVAFCVESFQQNSIRHSSTRRRVVDARADARATARWTR